MNSSSERQKVIDSLERIIHLYRFDKDDERFPIEIAKLVPSLFEFLRSENIYIDFNDHQIASPLNHLPRLAEAAHIIDCSTLPSSSKSTSSSTSLYDTSSSFVKDVETTSYANGPATPPKSPTSSIDELKKLKAKEYRETSRKNNPFLARARSLIARAKYLLGASASPEQIRQKALELLKAPARVPKSEYQFDQEGMKQVEKLIYEWKPRG